MLFLLTTRARRNVTTPERADAEAGFVLLAVLILVALLLIALAVAAPKVAQSIRRDKELELIHRGEQYKRGIKLYYKKFGAYPSSMDQLMNTNQIRFLRKRYKDPMTGKEDWKLIHFGQAHVKTLGLFGQPISNGGNSTTAGSSVLGGMGPSSLASGAAAAAPGTSAPSTAGTASGTGTTSSTSGSTQDGSSSGQSGFGNTGTSGFGSGSGGDTNPTFGGGPIVGVAIPDTKASIKEYLKQKHYNEWEFVYDPIEDQMQGGGAMFGGAGANLNGVGNGTTNPTSPTSGFGGTGFGSPTSGTGTSGTGTTPTNPTPTPQQ